MISLISYSPSFAGTAFDVRFAIRLARRTPVLTAITLLALAIGIGASSTIFAVVNGVLLKPLPYAAPDDLVMVWNHAPRDGGTENTISPADFRDFAARTRTLERLEGYFSFLTPLEVVIGDQTEIANAQTVTPGLFDMLGRPAMRGRTFGGEAGDEAAEVVVSHGYWVRRLGSDPGAIGRTLTLSADEVVTIIGVMPPDFAFPYRSMFGPWVSGGATTVSNIPLVAPQTLFEDRVVRLDLRLSKAFQIQRFRVQANLDAYNALNSNSIRAVNSAYGPQWRRPLQILDPRIIQVGGQISF